MGSDPTQSSSEDGGVELPAALYLQILEIALKTGKTEEEVLGGLMESMLNFIEDPDQTELKGFALEARKALRSNQPFDE